MASTDSPASTSVFESDLVRGTHVALRRFDNEAPGDWKPDASRPYETVGVVLSGRAELRVEGAVRALEPGDAYHVPQGATHSYHILESFTAIEATSPPAP